MSEQRPALLVSACLLGVRCNHRGEASASDAVIELRATHRLVSVCPEVAGGLSTPRDAAHAVRVATAVGERGLSAG